MIKVHILWKFNTVGGGGNQFLNTLRRSFRKNGVYEEEYSKADVILVNSKDCLENAKDVKKRYGVKVVHRIDGIFSIYRGEHERYNDLKVYDFAKDYADGVVFQSIWSRDASLKNGMMKHPKSVVILNCADDEHFKNVARRDYNGKLKLVTSSWSSNPKKGLETYRFLDEKLDFNKLDYCFAGRCLVSFKNIKLKGILSSKELANVLRSSDVFITATEDDACSNSIIEALSCGVVAVGLNSGGTPEIITPNNGELFDNVDNVIETIDKTFEKMINGKYHISVKTIEEVGKMYYDFMGEV